jgi:predicted RNase H-like nuclease (RuvC/YqgF family)
MPEEVTIEDLQLKLTEATKSIEGLTAKNQELLTETKTAKTRKREAEAEIEAERVRIAQEKGDHEQLYNSSQATNKLLKVELDELKLDISTKERDNASLGLATELAEGANVRLLSKFISPRLKYTDDGVRVLDDKGGLTVSSIEDLKTEFKNNADFKSLLKGNQSSGGGAVGGANSSGATKTLNRADFEALNAVASMKFIKDGGAVTE